MTTITVHRAYLELVQQFALRPIHNDRELDSAIKMIDSLLDRRRLTKVERDYFDVLTDLVEKYETVAHPMQPIADAELLSHLLEARGITQSVLSEATGIANSTISAVLHGRRKLSREHIGRLAEFFHVSPAAFAFHDAD